MNLSYSAAANHVLWADTNGAERSRLMAIPGAVQVAPTTVAAPCTVEAQVRVARMGYPAYSPILTSYNWPHGLRIKAPFAHQREMAAFLTLHHRAHNLAEIGTGKTLGCLWAADYLMRVGSLRKVLIVAPVSTLEAVWRDHIGEHFAGLRSCAVLYGSLKQRLKALARDVDYYIINNEGVALIERELVKRTDIGLIIIDESDRYRNRTTHRYKAMARIVGTRALWLNTGTPTPKEPCDAWAQQALLATPDMSFNSFKLRTMWRITQFKWGKQKDAKETVAQFMKPAIRFLRDECIDLPPTQVIDLSVAMSPAQTAALTLLKTTLKMNFPRGGQVSVMNEITMRGKVLQIMAGAIYDTDHAVHKIEAPARMAALTDILESSPNKVIVFAHLRSIVNQLHATLRKDYECAVVTGDVGLKARSEIFARFQSDTDPLKIIIADPGTMAHGLTLTKADTIIWYTPCDSSGTYIQANGRITRPGQVHKSLIYRIASCALERQIYQKLTTNETFQGLVMSWVYE